MENLTTATTYVAMKGISFEQENELTKFVPFCIEGETFETKINGDFVEMTTETKTVVVKIEEFNSLQLLSYIEKVA